MDKPILAKIQFCGILLLKYAIITFDAPWCSLREPEASAVEFRVGRRYFNKVPNLTDWVFCLFSITTILGTFSVVDNIDKIVKLMYS